MTRAGRRAAAAPVLHRRDRDVALGVSTAVVAKGIGLIAPLIITPACFRYLGDQRYGLWMAVTAVTAMAWFADLGLGNSLLTRLGQLADNPRQQAREVSSAYATVGTVAALLFGGVLIVHQEIPWDDLFGVTDPVIVAEAPILVLLCFAAFALNMPISLIQRVQYARGQVVRSNAWQSLGAFVSVVAVLAAISAEFPPLVVISLAVFSVPLTNLLNSLVYFVFQEPALRPRLACVDRVTLAGLLRLGLRFFALTILSIVAVNLDNPLIANLLGLSAAAHYALVGKLFGVVAMFFALVGTTIWPLNGAALTRGDVAWVRRTTGRMTVLYGVLVGLIGIGLIVFGQRIVQMWVATADIALIPVPVIAGWAAWTLVVALAYPMIMVQNSVGMLRPQLIGWSTFLPLAVGLKVWGLLEFGLAAVPLGGFLAYLVTMLPAIVIGYRRTLRKYTPGAAPPLPAEGPIDAH